MRIVDIQKTILIILFVIGFHSNTLQSMAYDYAQLTLLNVVNTGVHMVADANGASQLFFGLELLNYPVLHLL